MQNTAKPSWLKPALLAKVFGIAFTSRVLFFGFMLLPCLNTLTSIFRQTDASGNADPWRSSLLLCRQHAPFRVEFPEIGALFGVTVMWWA